MKVLTMIMVNIIFELFFCIYLSQLKNMLYYYLKGGILMLKIYNTKFLNSTQRFYKSILFGVLAAIGCSIIFSLFVKLTNFRFSIFYLLTGYLIAKIILDVGKGVHKKFSYLGAGLTIFSILLTELFIYTDYSIIIRPDLWISGIRSVLMIWSHFNSNSIITVFLQVWAVYIGYSNSSLASY